MNKCFLFDSWIFILKIYLLRLSPCDWHVFFGSYKKHYILVQCKAYLSKVNRGDIQKFESVLKDYPNDTLGIFVTLKKDNPAINFAQTSKSNY